MISKWILKEIDVASVLVLLVSYEEDETGSILWPGEGGVNGWGAGPQGGYTAPGIEVLWQLASGYQ